MKFNSAKVWPYAITFSIIMVFCFCVATIMVALTLPVEKSDKYMMEYHLADATVNDLIKAEIAFNAKYKIQYITEGLSKSASVLKYRVRDLENNPVNDATIKVIITRPNNHKHDQELIDPSISDGIYTFQAITLAQAGRWDVMAKVTVGKLERFYNVKADTRAKEAFEY